MSKIEIHLEAWPLFVTVLPPELTASDVEAYIADVMRLYTRRERFASLIDARPIAEFPSAVIRKRLGDWQNDTIDQIRRYNVCTATVISSSLVRGALTAMNWVFRPPNAQVSVATFEEGFDFCVQGLVRDGARLPAGLRNVPASSAPSDAAALRRLLVRSAAG